MRVRPHDMRFPYFVMKSAPVSGVKSLMDYEMCLHAEIGRRYEIAVEVAVPVTSLCPCSRKSLPTARITSALR